MGYEFGLAFECEFVRGILTGLRYTDYIGFVSEDSRRKWLAGVRKNTRLDWKIARADDGSESIAHYRGVDKDTALEDFKRWYQ